MTCTGQIVAKDYTGFSRVTLTRTDPIDVDKDIVAYNGRDFAIRNAFDVDRHPATQVRYWSIPNKLRLVLTTGFFHAEC
mgnify:CR=1 FL=1